MPAVMSDTAFQEWLLTNLAPRTTKPFVQMYEPLFVGMASPFPLAPPHVTCAHCGLGWTLDACHDIDNEGDFEQIDLTPFVGRTLREVEVELQTCTDAVRAFPGSLSVHNKRWEDPDREEQFSTPEQRGYRDAHSEDYPITLDYVVAPADSMSVFRYRFYHGPCYSALNALHISENDREFMKQAEQLFVDNGFRDVRILPASLPDHLRRWLLPELGDDVGGVPYYRVETREGTVGLWVAAYPMFDLEGSGVSLADFDANAAAGLQKGTPSVMPALGEAEQMLRLWQLMTKKQAASTPPAAL